MLSYTHSVSIKYDDPLAVYARLRGTGATVLFESSSTNERFGRLSLIGIQPSLALEGLEGRCTVRLLDARAQPAFDCLAQAYAPECTAATATELTLAFPPEPFAGEEHARVGKRCAAQPIRALLQAFKSAERGYAGLYGAFGYRFVYQYEDSLPRSAKAAGAQGVPDYRLWLFDTVLFFNHLTRECRLYATRATPEAAQAAAEAALAELTAQPERWGDTPTAGPASLYPTEATYLAQVTEALAAFAAGDLLEVVLSRELSAPFAGDPLHLYRAYRQLSPSPYLFYLDMMDEKAGEGAGEVLLGASPEMMVRVEDRRATLRPISGTVRRAGNPIEEHHAMLSLLNSEKEKSELDMLIDLARNDLARVCQPGVTVEDYRMVEPYSHVLHTVAQVSGTLEAEVCAYDALVATLNAGTLTGAPKVAAMQHIEATEGHHRGYYGGAVGYLSFTDEVNTGIVIRSAHVKDGVIRYCAGATLLTESDPEAELQEVAAKMAGFRQVLAQFAAPLAPTHTQA
ncbi:MAG: anthranilate synthase component I family protein [Bacteroidia bacterium]|nr:anthranilate synthase component I family protein [Bacteroidia bacterium]